MRIIVILEGDQTTNYSAYAPEVPGCVATGKTKEETLRSMQEALELHYGAMIADDDPLPEVTGVDCAVLDIPVEQMLAKRSAA